MSAVPAPAQSSGTVVSLQYLRFAASALVVLLHASAGLRQAGYVDDWTISVGNAGVDIFFVISGFVMAWITVPLATGAVGGFLRSRAIRIVPLYVLATLAAFAVLNGGENARGTGNLLRALLFVPIPVEGTERFTSVYGPGWTLSYEVFFYALAALSLLLPARVRVASTSALLVVAVALGTTIDRPASLAAFYTDPIVLEFVAGMVLAVVVRELVRRDVHVPRTVLIAAHVASWVLLAVLGSVGRDDLGDARVLRWGIPAALIVATGVLVERCGGGIRRVGILEHLGDASYAVYLSHLFTIRVLGKAWDETGLTDQVPAAVLFALAVVASIAVGSVVHRLVDVPLRRGISTLWPARPRTAVAG